MALMVVAFLGVATYAAQLFLLDPAMADAKVINVSGRQRMLSQRLALHVTTLAHHELSDDDRREREAMLERDITDMQAALVLLAPAPDDPQLTPDLRRHYFDEPSNLSRRTLEYLEVARAALDDSRKEGEISRARRTRVLGRSAALLPRLHAAVGLFEKANAHRLDEFHRALGLLFLAQLAALGLLWSFVLRPTGRHLRARERNQAQEERERSEREAEDRYVAEIQAGMENLDAEPDVMRLVGRAFHSVSSTANVELLLADSSEAHLRRAAVSNADVDRGCDVETPFDCPAVRNGRASTFRSSRALDACPRLADRKEACAAHCVPVNFMGRALGVLHATGPDGEPPDIEDRRRLAVLSASLGSRLGSIRAFDQIQLQASTDPLTGLFNRRAVEEKVRRLRQGSRDFAVAILDLDHFKALNDTFGHETGDRALTTFSKCLRESIGNHGIVGRFGGEEFIVIFPDIDRRAATGHLDETRMRLGRVLSSGDVPAYTVSGGVSDTTLSSDFAEMVSMADAALYRAKGAGRDRIVTHDEVIAEAPEVILSMPPPIAAE